MLRGGWYSGARGSAGDIGIQVAPLARDDDTGGLSAGDEDTAVR